MQKTLCIFAYNDRNQSFTDNLKYFLQNGLFESANITFCIVVSGASTTIQFPKQDNLHVLRRENRHGDFGAWGYALDQLGTGFDYFIFLNDTCRGPYIPHWAPRSDWVQFFCKRLDARCKLIGPTKNSLLGSHVQSYAFATDHIGLSILLEQKIFHPTLHYPAQKGEFIVQHEVRASKLLLEKGYEIAEFYNGNGGSSPYMAFHFHLSPFEVMYVKTNTLAQFDQRQISDGGGTVIAQPTAKFSRRSGDDKTRQVVSRSMLLKK